VAKGLAARSMVSRGKQHIKARLHGCISPPRESQSDSGTRSNNTRSRDRPIPGAPALLGQLLGHLIKRTKGD